MSIEFVAYSISGEVLDKHINRVDDHNINRIGYKLKECPSMKSWYASKST